MFEGLKQAYLPETNFPERYIDRKKCIKCGRCIEACPTKGLVRGPEDYPVPIGYGGIREACINCWNCVAVCPEKAIHVEGSYNVVSGRYKNTLTENVRFPEPFGPNAGEFSEFEDRLSPVEKVIFKRRSTRLYKKKPVPKELLIRILEAGRFAPSAGNCQPYKFIVITDRLMIQKLEKGAMKILRYMKNLYFEDSEQKKWWKNALFTTTSLFMPGKADPRPFTAMEKADSDNDVIYWNAPAVIIVCKNPRGISNPDLDVGICCQNMVLAAHSLGLGTCYIGLAVEPLLYPNMKKLREEIGAGKPWEPVVSFGLGYPKGKIDNAVKRDSPPVEWIE